MVEHRAGKRRGFSALKREGLQWGILLLGFALGPSKQAWSQSYEEQLKLPLASGKILWARVRFPLDSETKKLRSTKPAVMVFGGFQNAARVIDEVEHLELGREVILASFDYPFNHDRRFRFPQSLFLYPEVVGMLRDAIEGMGVLAELLTQDQRVEPGIIGLGASLGAPLMTIAASRSPRVSQVVLVHGFGNVPDVLQLQLERGLRKTFGGWDLPARVSSRVLASAAWYWSGLPEPEDEASHFRPEQSVLWIEAENDSFIPKAASKSLRESIQRSSARTEFKRTAGDHVQPGSFQLMREIGSTVGQWLRSVRGSG
ncbi:MAG: hypothetical protein KGQ59_03300 [Bdellovibrionales bacterium]|nr:hypothetical protein [Bdellovibrionales bacterium]